MGAKFATVVIGVVLLAFVIMLLIP